MPRQKQSSKEEIANEPDPDLEWSDDESTSPTKGENSSVEILKLLANYGYDVKGKIVDGVLSYTFRSKTFGNVSAAVPYLEQPGSPTFPLEKMETGRSPKAYHLGGSIMDPPPRYETGPSKKSTSRSSKKELPALRRKPITWFTT